MLLAVDIGNTSVVLGTFGDEGLTPLARLRLTSRREQTTDEWSGLIEPFWRGVAGRAGETAVAVVASVVPPITPPLIEVCRDRLGLPTTLFDASLDLGIAVRTDRPGETGADRLANAVAAFHRFGGPAIVVDVGTATKVDAVSVTGEFLGGAIAAGPGLAMDALARGAARLYGVDPVLPERAIGSNTVAAIQAGVMLGHLKMIEGLVEIARTELGGTPTVVLTGGGAAPFAGRSALIDRYEPDLTLQGLVIARRRGQGVRSA